MPELTGKSMSGLKNRVYIITNKQLLKMQQEFQAKLITVNEKLDEKINPVSFNHDTTNPEELKPINKAKEIEDLLQQKAKIIDTLNDFRGLKRILNEAEGHFLVAFGKVIVGHLTHFPLEHMESIALNFLTQNESDTFILKPRIDDEICDTSISVALHKYSKYVPNLSYFKHLTLTVDLPMRNKVLNLSDYETLTAYTSPSARPSDKNKRDRLLKEKAQTLEQLKNDID